jgi:hypothetical protein
VLVRVKGGRLSLSPRILGNDIRARPVAFAPSDTITQRLANMTTQGIADLLVDPDAPPKEVPGRVPVPVLSADEQIRRFAIRRRRCAHRKRVYAEDWDSLLDAPEHPRW